MQYIILQSEGIIIDKKWENHFNQREEECGSQLIDIQSIESIDDDNDFELVYETLVHGYSESCLINDLQTKLLQITPSKGFHLLGIFQDKFSE